MATRSTSVADRSPPWRSHRSLPLLCSTAGLLLAVVAQRRLEETDLSLGVLCVLVVSFVLWVVALATSRTRQFGEAPAIQDRSSGSARPLPLALALGFVVVTWIESASATYGWVNVVSWIAAICTWSWAWWPRDPVPRARWPGWRTAVARHGWLLLGLAGVVAIGAFFRIYQLGDIPSDPTSDHAEKLLDVHDLQNGERPVFFIRNTGREPAQFYVTYALMKGLGLSLSFETLKIGTALIGMLAIPAVFLFASEVAGRVTGLFASALFAIGTWPIGMARSGLRFGYGPLAAAFALWFLFRYMRRRDRRDALACGIAIGLGVHGYTSFRVVPLLVPLLLGLASLYVRRSWRGRVLTVFADTGLILATAFVACVPLARYTVEHADSVFFRARTRVVDSASWRDDLVTFVENTWNALLAFNWRGDSAWVNAVPFAPLLDVVTGAALLAGLAIVGYELVSHRSLIAAAIVVAAPILMLPSILSLAFPAENPGVNRLGAAAPIVFTVAALPFGFLVTSLQLGDKAPWRLASRSRLVSAVAALGLLALAMAIAAGRNYGRYFHEFAEQYRASVPNTYEITSAMRSGVRDGVQLDHTYLLGYSHWVDGRNVGFALGRPGWYENHNIEPKESLPLGDGQPTLYVLNPADHRRRAELMDALPGGRYVVVTSDVPGHDIALYSVPGR